MREIVSIQDYLMRDPNKGWQLFLNAVDREAEQDVESFCKGLLLGEGTTEASGDLPERDLLQEALRQIPDDEYSSAFVIGAISGVLVKMQSLNL